MLFNLLYFFDVMLAGIRESVLEQRYRCIDTAQIVLVMDY